MIKQHQMYYVPLSFVALTVLCFVLQSMTFLNGDVGSLLYDTRLFLRGGSYITDFLETNPPMIFILYAPVAMLTQWFSWDSVLVMRIYIIFLCWFSILLCAYALKRILRKEDYFLFYSCIYTFIFVYLFLPTIEFGQREHIFLMLFMPYVFTSVLVILNKKINPLILCLIGTLAGLGIGMKPYFLAPLVIIECYLMIKTRNIFSWIRIEALLCFGLLVFYLFFVYYFYPVYFKVLLPLVSHLYYVGIQESFSALFSRLSVIFNFFVLGVSLYLYKKYNFSSLFFILILALVGAIVTFIIPRAAWYYHVYPAIGISCLLIGLIVPHIISTGFKSKALTVKDIVLLYVAAFIVPLYILSIGIRMGLYVKMNSDLNDVIAYIQSTKKSPSIYCFSSNTTGDCFTLIYHTKSTYAGRYPFFWWLKGLRMLEKRYDNHMPLYLNKDKEFLVNMVAEDLNSYKPELLFINISDAKASQGEQFDFVRYFSMNQEFREAWQNYHYFKTIGVFEIYRRI